MEETKKKRRKTKKNHYNDYYELGTLFSRRGSNDSMLEYMERLEKMMQELRPLLQLYWKKQQKEGEQEKRNV